MTLPSLKSKGSYDLVPQKEEEEKLTTEEEKEYSMMDDPTCKIVLAKGVLQIVCLFLLLQPLAYMYVFTENFQPYHRGFFCDDQNLKHPYRPEQVPMWACIIIWSVICVSLILTVESLRCYVERDRSYPVQRSKTPWIAFELYRHFGYFVLGVISCLVFTEIAKYTIGRLRPHYLTLCDPDYSEELCRDPTNSAYTRFVTDPEEEVCRSIGKGEDPNIKKKLKEARLSFLSGHSSFSFFCGTFMVVYLQSRLARFPKSNSNAIQCTVRSLKIARPFIQFGLIILAFWISLTRISDYFHHPMDVLTGAAVGVLFASVTLIIIADTFNKLHTFKFSSRNKDGGLVECRVMEQGGARMGGGGGGSNSSRMGGGTSNRGRTNDTGIPLASAEDLNYIDSGSPRATRSRNN